VKPAPFRYHAPASLEETLELLARLEDAKVLAGGQSLVPLLNFRLARPMHLVDINRLPLNKIEALPDGGLTIGAEVRNSELAYHPLVRKNYAVLSEAILSGATAQIRNMATTAPG